MNLVGLQVFQFILQLRGQTVSATQLVFLDVIQLRLCSNDVFKEAGYCHLQVDGLCARLLDILEKMMDTLDFSLCEGKYTSPNTHTSQPSQMPLGILYRIVYGKVKPSHDWFRGGLHPLGQFYTIWLSLCIQRVEIPQEVLLKCFESKNKTSLIRQNVVDLFQRACQRQIKFGNGGHQGFMQLDELVCTRKEWANFPFW